MSKVDLLVPAYISRGEEGAVAPRRSPRHLRRPVTRTVHVTNAPIIRATRDWDILNAIIFIYSLIVLNLVCMETGKFLQLEY